MHPSAGVFSSGNIRNIAYRLVELIERSFSLISKCVMQCTSLVKTRCYVPTSADAVLLHNTGCPTKKFIFKIFVTQKLVKIKQ